MKNITIRTIRALGAAIRTRRLELGWSQAKLAITLGVQRQWVIRLEAGSEGAEVGTVLRALSALGLSVEVGNEAQDVNARSAPASNLDEVFARLALRERPAVTRSVLPAVAKKPVRKSR
jgi:transcriptional regulator with XRE-family HTH domain